MYIYSKRRTNHKAIITTIFSIALVSVAVYIGICKAYTNGFDPSRIMDDSVMSNRGSMSVTDIQNFLNSKVPNCDTLGVLEYRNSGKTRAAYSAEYGYPAPPYTCLKDYTERGKSAAQIIYEASQYYVINAQVLLVLLQKEQSLVTDDWPWPTQYQTATGYGCPDTAVCDSQYYGFFNQVHNAANMFRKILDASPSWYTPYVLGNNYIAYSPNAACGGTVVNIQNRATQALYNYTPYQPNQASLNAGYGTGDGCSSYGNRNFYSLFTDWFGTTLGFDVHARDGKVVKGTGAGAGVFKIENGTKRSFPSAEVFLTYYSWSDVITISNAEIANIPFGEGMTFNIHRLDGKAVKGQGVGAGVFKIENGTKRSFPTAEVFIANYQWSDVITVSDAEINNIPIGIGMSALDGKAVKGPGVGAGVFKIENGTKRSFPTAEVFYAHYNWSDVITVSEADINSYPMGVGMSAYDGKVVKGPGAGAGVFKIENGTKRSFPTAEVFTANYRWSDVITISEAEMNSFPIGEGMY